MLLVQIVSVGERLQHFAHGQNAGELQVRTVWSHFVFVWLRRVKLWVLHKSVSHFGRFLTLGFFWSRFLPSLLISLTIISSISASFGSWSL